MPDLRWRRAANGDYIARPNHNAPTYRITGTTTYSGGRPGKLWRLYVNGDEVTDAAGCTLRHIQRLASTHAEGK